MKELQFEHSDAVKYAINNYPKSKIGFVDLLIGCINRNQGCLTTKTLDQKAAKTFDFEL